MPKDYGKIQNLSLQQFTVFEKAAFDFSPGINVLIGANGTGKSHMMKIAYSLMKTAEPDHEKNSDNNLKTEEPDREESFDSNFSPKICGVFRVNSMDNLIRFTASGSSMPGISLNCVNGLGSFQIWIRGGGWIPQHIRNNIKRYESVIYLPAQEFLSINKGFISAYTRRELPYDETYYDLALALDALPLREDKIDEEIREAITLLRKIITDKQDGQKEVLTHQNGEFHFHLSEGDLNVHLVAEGYRKIATLYYLLRNGSLTKESILFWDEPEANLNPKLIVKIAEVLQVLARSGMQIFVATHDYLLSHELSLSAEYPSEKSVDIKFFALRKPDRTSGVSVESGQTLADIEHNPILEEFAAHYDRESSFFHNS